MRIDDGFDNVVVCSRDIADGEFRPRELTAANFTFTPTVAAISNEAVLELPAQRSSFETSIVATPGYLLI